MQTSTLMPLQDRSNVPAHSTQPNGVSSFFEVHPIGEIIRGLFFSSILWVLLAIVVYMVYSMVLSSY
jgi:hypothetical protein